MYYLQLASESEGNKTLKFMFVAYLESFEYELILNIFEIINFIKCDQCILVMRMKSILL
jgi:hypothetical protein